MASTSACIELITDYLLFTPSGVPIISYPMSITCLVGLSGIEPDSQVLQTRAE